MSPEVPQGTGFATMPRGLTAEVGTERFEMWRQVDRALRRETRIVLEGGPFAEWAWLTSLAPDRFLAEDGQYRPLLQSNRATIDNEAIVYVWTAFEDET